MRWLSGSISDWDALFKEAYRVLRPGGFVESHEPSCFIQGVGVSPMTTGTLSQWGDLFAEAGRKSGRPFDVVEAGIQKRSMEAAGFVDIEEKVLTVSSAPLGYIGANRCYRSRSGRGQKTRIGRK